MDRWVGKVAVVTGGSAGIGLAIATALVNEGLKVAALDLKADKFKQIEADLAGKKGQIKCLKCDVTKEEDITRNLKWVTDNWGPVHVLVNNAGILRCEKIQEMTTNVLRAIMETNVIAATTCSREVLKIMKNAGIDDGHIVNVNSTAGYHPYPMIGMGQYTASKQASTVLTEYLRHELAVTNTHIRVTSISPGATDTDLCAQFTNNAAKLDQLPKILPPSAIAQCVVFALSSPPIVNISEMIIQPVGEYILGQVG